MAVSWRECVFFKAQLCDPTAKGSRTVPVFQGVHFCINSPWPQRLKANRLAVLNIDRYKYKACFCSPELKQESVFNIWYMMFLFGTCQHINMSGRYTHLSHLCQFVGVFDGVIAVCRYIMIYLCCTFEGVLPNCIKQPAVRGWWLNLARNMHAYIHSI